MPAPTSAELPRSAPPVVPRGWAAACLARTRHRFWLKAAGVSGFIWLFFIAYFALLRQPAAAPRVMPLGPLDHAIGFQPWAVVPYLSLWVYVGIAPGLLVSWRELLSYGLWAGAMYVAGLTAFYLVPTAVPPDLRLIGADGQPLLELLHGVDAAGNACPSLHVAGAVFSALWIGRLLREVGAPAALVVLNAAWALAIVYSTLAIKQHVVLDVWAGALLGLLFAWPSVALRARREDRPGRVR